MNLDISSFADAGNYVKERLVIKVLRDTDIGEYAVLSSAVADDGNPTPGGKIAYWFPDGDVKAGDIVVLYTKSGNAGRKELSLGRTAHFYYWAQSSPLWGSASNSAVILAAASWIHKRPT